MRLPGPGPAPADSLYCVPHARTSFGRGCSMMTLPLFDGICIRIAPASAVKMHIHQQSLPNNPQFPPCPTIGNPKVSVRHSSPPLDSIVQSREVGRTGSISPSSPVAARSPLDWFARVGSDAAATCVWLVGGHTSGRPNTKRRGAAKVVAFI